MNETRAGVLDATAAYLWWGLSPLYWKTLESVPATQLVAHRIIWSALLLVALLAFRGRLGEVRRAVSSRRVLATLAATTALIATNWFLYIWAITTDRILEAGLGYYVTPLVTVLLGLVVLGERLTRAQAVSLAVAGTGVLLLALRLGRVPWIALTLALSFSFYGLLRKTVRAEPESGLLVETGLLAPWMLAYLVSVERAGTGVFGHTSLATDLLVAASGVVTAAPLVWFTRGARRLDLTTLGFLQYLAPTAQVLLAVLVYREPFGPVQLVAFCFIWAALALFSYDGWTRRRRLRGAA